MPKIEVHQDQFFKLLGRSYTDHELEAIFPAAKAELDEKVNAEGLVKIELNDTNRPDLWSAAGLARLIKVYQGAKHPEYGFFSKAGAVKSAKYQIKIDASASAVRPFAAAFVATGPAVTDASLKALIQAQEKLCWNYGQKRKSISMGIYRSDLITFPVTYRAVKPTEVAFVPLAMTEKLTLDRILRDHPKGQEFGSILEGASVYPILEDATGKVLSFPPIINSADLGAVKVGDTELFVELTGTDQKTLTLATSIVACDLADLGWTIEPVESVYAKATELGQSVTTPFYFQSTQKTSRQAVVKLLGEDLSMAEIQAALEKMGNGVRIAGDSIEVSPAPYRNDFLHEVDIIEDVMIGRDLNSFAPELPRAFTVGRLAPIELASRRVKSLMVGLGYQEMIFNYLGSARDFIQKMDPRLAEKLAGLTEGQSIESACPNTNLVQILNPMSENFEYVRNSIIPNLLGAEAVSGNAPYPHAIFETGKTAVLDSSENYRSRSSTYLGFLYADQSADFNVANAQIAALLYYLGVEFSLEGSDDPRFLAGRQATVLIKGQPVGVFGELHPGILSNWGVVVPCAAGELDLERFLV